MSGACDACLRRTDLIAAVAGSIDVAWREKRGRTARVLALPDEDLLGLDPSAAARYERFDAAAARGRIAAAGLDRRLPLRSRYPERLRELPDPPAVLHVAGSLAAVPAGEAVAIVGARRATPYGLEVSRSLGRGLTAAGLPVVSGMALGIDSAAHAGALEVRRAAAPPVAVLAGGAETAYPARMRSLHARLIEAGAVVSEMPPGFTGHRWCFPVRNRIIAALSTVTIVVEAATLSGSLITADLATDLGRVVAAVPGPVTSRYSAGANELLHAGARSSALARRPRPGARRRRPQLAGRPRRSPLDPAQRRVARCHRARQARWPSWRGRWRRPRPPRGRCRSWSCSGSCGAGSAGGTCAVPEPVPESARGRCRCGTARG